MNDDEGFEDSSFLGGGINSGKPKSCGVVGLTFVPFRLVSLLRIPIIPLMFCTNYEARSLIKYSLFCHWIQRHVILYGPESATMIRSGDSFSIFFCFSRHIYFFFLFQFFLVFILFVFTLPINFNH